MSLTTLPARAESLSSRVVHDLIERQPLLARTALAMLVLAIPVAVLTLVDPRLLQGVSVWTKPFKFLVSTAFFLGTLASGAFHGWGGMHACLWAAAIALAIAWAVTLVLPRDAAQEAA